MRLSLVVFVVLLAVPDVWAQQPNAADYFSARDRARASLHEAFGACDAGEFPTKGREQAFEAAVARIDGELEAMMRQMIGPGAAPKGFSGPGTWSASPSNCGMGMDAIDGIAWGETVNGALARVLVTPLDVLRRWMTIHEPKLPERQADPDAAFAAGRITPDIIDLDGWTAVFAFLPIVRPAGVDAVSVFVGAGGNGTLIWPPRELDVYLRKADRVYIAYLPLAVPFAPLEACDTIRREAPATPEGLALDLFNKCWEEHGRNEPAFGAAIGQAQAFVDDLAAP